MTDLVDLNPKPNRSEMFDNLEVSFVPMASVEAGSGQVDVANIRKYAEVKKGYTYFREGDILFAKITPCMENGKIAVVHGLKNGIGFGSTEFHVLRPKPGINPHYVYHFISSSSFRASAAHEMTGAVGQKRVPAGFLESALIPEATGDEQLEIVAELEKQFSRLDEAVANLKRVKANLKRYKAAVLSSALRGQLWATHPTQANSARPEFAPEIDLPSGWSWASTAEVCDVVASGSTPKADEMVSGSGEVPFLKVYNLGFDGSLDFTVKPTFVRRAIHEGPLNRSRCFPGDVLMNIVGPPLGKISFVPGDFPEWNINQAIVTFRAGPRVLNRLLAFWLMSPEVGERIERTSKATAGQFNVQVSTCRKLVLPMPPVEEQRNIVDEIDRRLSIVQGVEAEVDVNLRRAHTLRQTILARAFASGC
ncbi:MAG: hypothetical protein JNM76_03130 [Betaproteobacteria bacterium]|nr:hypothetical protein [Betaproteobacteria bacterium]